MKFIKNLLFAFTLGFLCLLPSSFLHVSAQALVSVQPQVDINLDSGYPEVDPALVSSCYYSFLTDNFPFDQFFMDSGALNDFIGSVSQCPQFEIWDNEYDLCFLLDIYDNIASLILAGILYNAIINL